MHSFLPVVYCLLFVAATVLLTLGAYAGFSRWRGKRGAVAGNEFTGIMFGAVSLIYSLIIAFVIIAVWEDYEELNSTIEQETDKLNNIIVHSTALPDSLRTPINAGLHRYCTNVIDTWGKPDTSRLPQASALPGLRLLLLNVTPANHLQENLLDVLDDNISAISDLRRERLGHIHSHVPTLVWLILISGSVMILLFSFLVHTESAALKRTGISFLSALIGMSLFLVYALDHPLNTGMQINNEAYQKILRLLRQQNETASTINPVN